FVGGVEQLLHGTQRAAQPDEDRCQSERHDQGGHPERDPHEALTAHRLNTLRATTANTTAIVSAGPLVDFWIFRWFFGFAARPGHEASERLKQQREHQGRKQVGLAEPQRRQAEEVPELAQGEAQSRHQQRRDVSAPAIRQESKTELGDDQDEQHRHDEAGGDQFHLPISPSGGAPLALRATSPCMGRKAPSEGGGWVVLSMLRWVPCLGSRSPVNAGVWSALRPPGALFIDSSGSRARRPLWV